ncbi:pectate lyase superfamily protein-domain-containing protein [Dichotomopilus funicola]|uniref:Pectate lyase superfamily protein-domain-containing protein n=1 Tax=Dichotomopilus funicola TaxID=1934379 RepID=A0AAN6V511_9PEZI|nr:pectate lyase superfamily protein-domain-containing protein [Dichotomopilus funicola]
MRHDGQWYHSDLEPGTTANVIRHLRDSHNNIQLYSGIHYTCDEFPPVTWFEGGDGEFADNPGTTRCAAMRCAEGVKAEQDWQATAHNAPRLELQAVVELDPTIKQSFNSSHSVVFFRFTTNTAPDGVAARVVSYDVDPDNGFPTLDNERTVQQGFRKRNDDEGINSTSNSNYPPRGLWDLSHEQLQDLVDAGFGTEYAVPANDSYVDWAVSAPIPGELRTLDRRFRWDMEDDEAMGLSNRIRVTKEDRAPGSFTKWLTKKSPAPPTTTQRSIPDSLVQSLLKRAVAGDVANAQAIVDKAKAESAKRNAGRLARRLRNAYGLRLGTIVGSTHTQAEAAESSALSVNKGVVPLLNITDEIANAAALVAEAEAKSELNTTSTTANTAKRATAGAYWMGSLARKGIVPWGDDASYVVFRNVLDYGAVGDGVTDDTAAIKKAMTSGNRCGVGCNGSTTKNAIVYFPPGSYLISSTVPMPFGTQVIGDAIDRPTLLASGSFVGLGVLSTDEYTGGQGGSEEYYINTANFYRQIRNIAIDITQAGANISCLHYQVAQATSLQNVELIASTDAGKNQIGMYAENGSGGQISDVTFTGGSIGLYGGNQQFTAQRLTFDGCNTGVHVIWDWGWVWKSVTMKNVNIGFQLTSDDGTGNIGSVAVMDSSFSKVGTAGIVIAPPSSDVGSGSTSVVLENVQLSGVAAAVQDTAGTVHLSGSDGTVGEWVGDHRRNAGLLDNFTGAYFERAKPQYEDRSVDDFVHVRDYGATGDGLGKILFVDAGSYILTSTIMVPDGAKIDASKPKVLIQVGLEGLVGNVEMQDLLFTTRGPTAGLILVEWNIRAASPGSAALWDCHARIGGATGTELTPTECPPSTSGTDAGCSAASLMMRLSPHASGYFENMWLRGADHMIDDPDLTDPANDMTQCSIYVARGFLIESTHPTWLYATASEHAVFYQYNFHSASNIFAGMLQTGSPYFAAVVGNFPGDPDYTCAADDGFSGCDESWSTIITGSQDIFIASAGIYSWFSTCTQTCIDTQECQTALILLENNFANVRFQNLISIGSKYMAVMDGQGITAAHNLNVETHPFWSQITILDVGSDGTTNFNELVWIDPIWDMENPSFTCLPPCHIKLPPYTAATTTTSTITKAPLMVSEWVLEIVTITADGGSNNRNNAKRDSVKKCSAQGFSEFTPVPATTPFWPSIVYEGINGHRTTTAPSVAFPTPPPGIVQRGVMPYQSVMDNPFTEMCGFLDYSCVNLPWLYGDQGTGVDQPFNPDDNPADENGEDEEVKCPGGKPSVVPIDHSSSSSSTATPSATTSSTSTSPEPSPWATGKPEINTVGRYNTGETTENERMQNAAIDFCNSIKPSGSNLVLGPNYFSGTKPYDFPWNGGIGTVEIVISLLIEDKCQWSWNMAECQHYLSVPTDSCNCGGINGKQGGIVSNNCYSWRVDPNRKLF